MYWKVVIPQETKMQTLMVSALGEWIATWGPSSLFGMASSDGGLATEQKVVRAPEWLITGWERYWNGETFEISLCTEIKPSVTTAAVWKTVLAISFGETLSYGEVALRSGIPGGARAVGAIMRANPWALFLPCHRVIGKDGRMRGYGGPSGVSLKMKLIEHERKLLNERKGGP
jgi:methylated-DNA-[protein]-cysteine S-methyltransferase